MKWKQFHCFLFALLFACSCSLDPPDNEPGEDFVSPSVTAVAPFDGEDSVSVVPSISVHFSEAVEHFGAEQAFSLSDGGGDIKGSFIWSDNTMIFGPDGELEEFTIYSIEVLGGMVADSSGNVMGNAFLSSFTTGADTHPPHLNNWIPEHQSVDVPQRVKIELEFSEPMDKAAVEQAFTLTESGSPVAGDFNWSGNTVRFRPLAPLADLATYQATLAATATDDSNNAIMEALQISFTVGVVIDIAAGNQHSLVAMSGGTVKAWGYNIYGQAGSIESSYINTPVAVEGASDVVAVAAGRNHSVALISDGSVRTWGFNSEGQLGNGSNTSSDTPVVVSGITNATAIDAGVSDHFAYGGNHTLVLLSDGTVAAWGSNDYGQLGNNSTTDSNVPVTVTGITNAVAVAAGGFHSLALLSDGTIKAWGRNSYGQLGNSSTEDSSTPVNVGGISNAVAVAAGRLHSLALLSDGTIKAWGYGGRGQLGEGIYTWRWSPVYVDWINTAVSIAAGASHSAAVLADHTIEAWGANSYGQIGCGGSASEYPLAMTVSGIDLAVKVSGGEYHTVAFLSDGTVKAWGANGHGELGDGSYNPSNTPVTVIGF